MQQLTHEQTLSVIRDAGQRIADHAHTIADGLDGKLDTYTDAFGEIMTPEKQVAAALHAIEQAVDLIRRRSGQETAPHIDRFSVEAS